MKVEPFQPEDLDRIEHLQPTGWDDIRPFFRLYLASPFCHPVRVVAGKEVIGLGAAMSNGATGWVSHIIVVEDHRRRGIGGLITRHLIALLEELGAERQLLIATEDGEPLYTKLGFVESCRYLFFAPRRLAGAKPPADLRPLTPADLPGLYDLDRRATGEDRSWMIAPFADNGWVRETTTGEGICGFFLPELGEGAIVADDPESGQALLLLKHSLAGRKTVLPDANEPAIAFLTEHGFQLVRQAARMVRPAPDPCDPARIFARVGGHYG